MDIQERVMMRQFPFVKYVTEEYLDIVPKSRQWKVQFAKRWNAPRGSKNKQVEKVRKEYMKVQRQQLEFITNFRQLPRTVEWVLLIDDDTWVDVEGLFML